MIETIELYGGEVKLQFEPARHRYFVHVKGRKFKVPSVTGITSILDKSGPLVNWAINNTLGICRGAITPGTEYAEIYLEEVWNAAKRASQTIKTEAAQKGTALHKAVEASFKEGAEQPFNQLVLSLRDCLGTLQCRVVANERKVYSRRYRYSGTFDALGEIGGELVLLDWKTGKSIYPEYRLQTAAYCHAWEEEFPDQPISGRYLVHITDDAVTPHYFPRSTYRLDFKGFLGAKALYDRVKQIEKSSK